MSVYGITCNEVVYFIRPTLLVVPDTECLGTAIVISNRFSPACVYFCTADQSMAIDGALQFT